MIDSYWDLYVAYIAKCMRDNWNNDIDPNHYDMEWNHFLPRCIFGDQPIGQWLTVKQHAIATALQSLAFNRCILCPWHVKHLPQNLWDTVFPIYSKDKSRLATETNLKHKGKPIGFQSPEYKNSPEYLESRRNSGRKAAEEGTGAHSPEYKNSDKYKEDRDRGRETSKRLGIGIYATWVSTIDGYTGTPGVVARHNKLNGWDPNARIKLS